jgi:hypothetical protein
MIATTHDCQTVDRWYIAADSPELVEYGPVRGLGVTGQGAPGGPTYSESAGALYAVAEQLLRIAAQAGAGFPMPPLEGRWWVEDDRPPLEVPREEWRWHLFLRLPDTVEPSWVDQAREAALETVLAAPRVQLVTFAEGRCVQTLHAGPYADEPRTLGEMDRLMEREGLARNGLHHEIYLSDVHETDPERMRTILRQPVRPAGPATADLAAAPSKTYPKTRAPRQAQLTSRQPSGSES